MKRFNLSASVFVFFVGLTMAGYGGVEWWNNGPNEAWLTLLSSVAFSCTGFRQMCTDWRGMKIA